MKILLDTNILIPYLSGREDRFSSACEKIVQMCAEEEIEGVVAFHSLSTVWYVARKAPDELRRGYIRTICVLFSIAGAKNEAVLQAVDRLAFRDFEDALQDCCAQEADCDYIITANGRDFAGRSRIPAVSPDEFLALLSKA